MKSKSTALLVLADGSVFEGRGFGAKTSVLGECVFHTGHTGYQEILSDPSYSQQFIVFTDPHIGNEGFSMSDFESRKLWAAGAIVRDLRESPYHWRGEKSLTTVMQDYSMPGISGVDTRRLVLHLRDHGAQWAVLSTDGRPLKELQKRLMDHPRMEGLSLSASVTTSEIYEWSESVDPLMKAALPPNPLRAVKGQDLKHCVVMDFGVKFQILRLLRDAGFTKITVVPAQTSAEKIKSLGAEALFLSNGPGDPAAEVAAIQTVRELLDTMPIFGICLGHQILALALGLQTYKLKFGHHGANHPVRNSLSGLVEITSQNHGFAVAQENWPSDLELTHINLNDQTVEGFRQKARRLRAIQFHPEAAPGPLDSLEVFRDFQRGFA